MNTLLLLLLSIAIFFVISLAAYYYLEKTKEKRLRAVKREKKLSSKDEAYNRLKTAKRATELMQRRGKKVKQAKDKITKAEQALQKGDSSQAKKITNEVKEELSKAPTIQEDEDSSDKEFKKAYTVDELESLDKKSEESASERRKEMEKQKEMLESLPDNYLESKFEIEVARDLLQEEPDEEAERYFIKAEKCFEDEDYTEALRYSIKCKKTIKGEDAGLISGQDIDKKSGPPKKMQEKFPDLLAEDDVGKSSYVEEEKGSKGEDRAVLKADEVDKTPKKECPGCGYRSKKDDTFCPKCGTELNSLIICGDCGSENESSDRFCRKCGSSLEETEMVCPECGTEVEDEDKFCPGCGVKFD